MKKLSVFVCLALWFVGAGQAQIPQTPAKLQANEIEAARTGAPFRQYAAWLEAFNSGDRERIRKFVEANYPTATVEQQANFRERTGGFELRALEQATPTTVVGVMQERGSDQFARFSLT